MRPKRNVELASGRAMGVHGVGIGAAVVVVWSASVESLSFNAGSLVTVGLVKHGDSSLTGSSVRACTAIQYSALSDGSEADVSVTLRAALWKLRCVSCAEIRP